MEDNKKNDKQKLSLNDAINESQNKSLIPEPIVVGNLRKENTSPIGIIIFFAILLFVAFFLPKITAYFNKEEENNSHVNVSSSSVSSSLDNEDISNDEDITYYDINDSSSFTVNDLTINNINLTNQNNEYQINFVITNNSPKTISSDDNYFLELYSSEKSFIERILIGKIKLESKKTLNETLNISSNAYNNAKLMIMDSKSNKEYPKVNLDYGDQIRASMTCTKNDNKLTYTFIDDKLITIVENYTLDNSKANFNNELEKYQSIYQTYSKIEGIETTFNNSGTSFEYTSSIDLAKVKFSSLKDSRFYKKNTSASIVKYELEASLYTCTQ